MGKIKKTFQGGADDLSSASFEKKIIKDTFLFFCPKKGVHFLKMVETI